MAANGVQTNQLVVFDFDWSLVDQDTDRYVFEVLSLSLRRKLKDLKPKYQWTDLMAMLLKELHEEGFTKEQVQESLRILPLHPAMKRALKDLKGRQTPGQTTFLCLSNSNQVFIDTLLERHQLTDIFIEIITNPAHFESSGLLNVRRRVDPNGEQHGCKVGCSPNMCKGKELHEFLEKHGGREKFDRVVYVGDGGNDFCPILRLRPQDLALVRSNRELQIRVEREGKEAGLQCQVKYWGGAWEIEEIFQGL